MTRVKICGLRTAADAASVNQHLPEYAGFVFAESRRRVSPDDAAALREMLDPRIVSVGVFVNQSPDDIVSLLDRGVIGGVQLHGDEDEEYIALLRKRFSGLLIRAVPVFGAPPAPPSPLADYPLFDTGGRERGGSGAAFNWALLKDVGTPFFLAGGLNPNNVARAISMMRPFCVDVSSGVETDGAKDPEKIKRFIDIVRRESK